MFKDAAEYKLAKKRKQESAPYFSANKILKQNCQIKCKGYKEYITAYFLIYF